MIGRFVTAASIAAPRRLGNGSRRKCRRAKPPAGAQATAKLGWCRPRITYSAEGDERQLPPIDARMPVGSPGNGRPLLPLRPERFTASWHR